MSVEETLKKEGKGSLRDLVDNIVDTLVGEGVEYLNGLGYYTPEFKARNLKKCIVESFKKEIGIHNLSSDEELRPFMGRIMSLRVVKNPTYLSNNYCTVECVSKVFISFLEDDKNRYPLCTSCVMKLTMEIESPYLKVKR